MGEKLNLCKYETVFFNCEGTNEEAVLRWIIEQGRMAVAKDVCNLDFTRARSNKGRMALCRHIDEHDYDAPVAIVYICDRPKEKWKLTKEMKRVFETKNVDWLHVVTYPEIEILLTMLDDTVALKWEKYKKQHRSDPKVSEFCKEYFRDDIKDGNGFIEQFCSFKQFAEICVKYKREHTKLNTYTLADLIK